MLEGMGEIPREALAAATAAVMELGLPPEDVETAIANVARMFSSLRAPEQAFVYAPPVATTRDQRATLGLLLERHPKMLTVDQLRAELAGVDVDQALSLLQADGLVSRVGDLVGATRAAVRAEQLAL
jgi:hypothetical protein